MPNFYVPDRVDDEPDWECPKYVCPICGELLEPDDELHIDDNGDVIACPHCYGGTKVAEDCCQPAEDDGEGHDPDRAYDEMRDRDGGTQ